MKIILRDPNFITLRSNIAIILDDGRNVAAQLGVETAIVSWDENRPDRCQVTIELDIPADSFRAEDKGYIFPGETS